MGCLKWFDRFLTNEIVAQNRFLSRRRRKNRFLRSIKEIRSTMGLSPENTLTLDIQCKFGGVTGRQETICPRTNFLGPLVP